MLNRGLYNDAMTAQEDYIEDCRYESNPEDKLGFILEEKGGTQVKLRGVAEHFTYYNGERMKIGGTSVMTRKFEYKK